ncbi:MAG: hypothetical protein IPI00_08400 [Flavobacteriales bacterium]|nr:hypothetical protein [Flavobacteriales bacterium]MBK6943981.1 hypothetical protein [Flavobacteriales bacterium]MBK7240186.1 hypothetical protein [Flavobacteriales bacterium]MBK9533650.1 hypothetical protein [Flavobacteriales bacterium]MBP9136940.1 hypothetical protein [Flavobacteriales bacterium]
MEEKLPNRSTDYSKAVAPLLTVLGITVGAWQFTSQMSHESKMEFSRSMYTKKLQAYEEVGKAVGDLLVVPHDERLWISAEDTMAFDSCLERFRTCYWGVLPLVEDSTVEVAMIQFKDMARFYRRGENDYHDLAREGMSLMNACNQSLENHWSRPKKGE